MGRPAKYPPEFQREAVELVLGSGRSINEVALSRPRDDAVIGFRFVEDHRGVDDAKRMCALVEVPRSNFDGWASGPSAPGSGACRRDRSLLGRRGSKRRVVEHGGPVLDEL